MNKYINKLSCWYIEQRSTSVGSDISYFNKQMRVDPDQAVALFASVKRRLYDINC